MDWKQEVVPGSITLTVTERARLAKLQRQYQWRMAVLHAAMIGMGLGLSFVAWGLATGWTGWLR